jgi:hypothetical protein
MDAAMSAHPETIAAAALIYYSRSGRFRRLARKKSTVFCRCSG